MYILIAVLVFGFLIFIHELGHYIAARIFHVKIFEFAIGMGPRLFWYKSKKTKIVYALRMIPIGGFVSMKGELAETHDEEEDEKAEAIVEDVASTSSTTKSSDEDYSSDDSDDSDTLGALAEKSAWKRLIVHMAGAMMNLLFGFVAAIVLTCILDVGGTTIAEFVPAEDASITTESQGLAVGDEVIKVGKHRVHIADQLFYEILHQGGGESPLELTVRRGQETLQLTINFPSVTEQGQSFGDYDFKVFAEKKTPGVLIKQSFFKSCYMVNMVWDSLIDLITGRYTFEAVSGPVGTATVISDAARRGATTLFYLAALISVNLGVFNLLPLPALDGGHVFYTLFEILSRKRLNAKVVTILDTVGLIVLFGLMIVVTCKDIFGLF